MTEYILGTRLCPACNTAKMGKKQKEMYNFCVKWSGKHLLASDSYTQKIAKSLVRRGLIVIDDFGAMSLA